MAGTDDATYDGSSDDDDKDRDTKFDPRADTFLRRWVEGGIVEFRIALGIRSCVGLLVLIVALLEGCVARLVGAAICHTGKAACVL